LSATRDKAVRDHRRRLKKRGLKRVEIHAAESDAALIRQLARILRDDSARAELVRTRLNDLVSERPTGLKALLAAAPLEGIRITRARESGRTIEL
jgi:phosphohistidine phosphatase SixA